MKPITVAYCSDLHLDFDYPDFSCFDSAADVLFILGDVMESKWFDFACNPNSSKFGEAQKLVDLFQKLSNDYETVLMVLGNHEHYHGTFQDTANIIKDFFKLHKVDHNVKLLVDETYVLENGMVVYGDTFWTDMGSPHDHWFIKQRMNDFHLIKFKEKTGYRKFNPIDAAACHLNTYNKFLSVKADIILSHHAPTEKSVPLQYKGDELNAAYHSSIIARQLHEMEKPPKYWFHGHMHSPVDHLVNKTHVLANPRGYGKENPNWRVKCLKLKLAT